MAYKYNPLLGVGLDEVGAGGGAATPGGADTQVQFNDGGALGGDAGLTYDKTTDKLTVGGDIDLDDGGTFSTTLQTVTPTANRTVSIPDATGTIGLVNGPTGSIQFNQAGALNGTSDFSTSLVWNSATTTFTGLKLNVTDTASAAGSKLLDLQVNGSRRAAIDSTGVITCTSVGIGANNPITGGSNNILSFPNSSVAIDSSGSVGGFSVNGNGFIGFASAAPGGTSSIDATFRRDAANILAQRNGTNAQAYRLYNTYTDASNYERGKVEWSSNLFRIGTEAGGSGGTLRAMELDAGTYINFNLAGTNKFGIGGSSNISYQKLAFGSDNLHDIGSPAATRPRHIYAGSSITGPHNLQGTAPASATATGTTGDIRYDADYIYICTATNTWKRAAISAW